MTDNELLLALSDMMDKKLEPINVQVAIINEQMQAINERMDGLELQIKSTERNLKNQIMKSESLVLDEVERVHTILDAHKQDTKKHTA